MIAEVLQAGFGGLQATVEGKDTIRGVALRLALHIAVYIKILSTGKREQISGFEGDVLPNIRAVVP